MDNSRSGEHPVIAHIRGVIHMIDQAKRGPSASVLADIRSSMLNIMVILRIPDPLIQELLTAAAVLIQSTKEQTYHRNGRELVRVTITDQVGYGYAIRTMHKVIRRIKC